MSRRLGAIFGPTHAEVFGRMNAADPGFALPTPQASDPGFAVDLGQADDPGFAVERPSPGQVRATLEDLVASGVIAGFAVGPDGETEILLHPAVPHYAWGPAHTLAAELRGSTSLSPALAAPVRDERDLAANEMLVDAEAFDAVRRHVLGDGPSPVEALLERQRLLAAYEAVPAVPAWAWPAEQASEVETVKFPPREPVDITDFRVVRHAAPAPRDPVEVSTPAEQQAEAEAMKRAEERMLAARELAALGVMGGLQVSLTKVR